MNLIKVLKRYYCHTTNMTMMFQSDENLLLCVEINHQPEDKTHSDI